MSVENRITEHVQTLTEPATIDEICAAIKSTPKTVRQILNQLSEKGVIANRKAPKGKFRGAGMMWYVRSDHAEKLGELGPATKHIDIGCPVRKNLAAIRSGSRMCVMGVWW